MITFYIDESGKMKDKAQPVALFCGVGIKNDKYTIASEFMIQQRDNLYKIIQRQISNILNSTNLAPGKKHSISQMLNKNLFNKFEIHAKEMIHGKDEFVFLSKGEKEKTIKEICQFVVNNEINIIVVKADRTKIEEDNSIKDKNKYLSKKMSENLINTFQAFFELKKEQGVLIFDNGNEFIQKNFIEYVQQHIIEYISPHIVQADSCATPLLQMADIIAYITKIHFDPSSKYYGDLNKYYEMIEDNIKLIDITDTTDLEIKEKEAIK